MSQRHPALQPLSRDHHNGLVQVHRLLKAANESESVRAEAITEFRRAWRDEIAPHFDEEEALLPPLLSEEEISELLRQHERLRALANEAAAFDSVTPPPSGLLQTLGDVLQKHIRWEERELFPSIESTASQEQLDRLAKATLRNEKKRRPE